MASIKEYTDNLEKLELYENYMSMIHYDGSSNVHCRTIESVKLGAEVATIGNCGNRHNYV